MYSRLYDLLDQFIGRGSDALKCFMVLDAAHEILYDRANNVLK